MSNSNRRNNISFITLTAVFTALVYVFTWMVHFQLPFGQGGLVHLGNVPLFICAILLGRKSGAIAGAFGMGLFDLLSGWTLWAPFTFVIVGLMGYTVGAIAEKKNGLQWYGIAISIALVIKIVGYYIAEWIIYGNFIAPVASIPGNIIQISVAAVVTLVAIKPIQIAVKKAGIRYA